MKSQQRLMELANHLHMRARINETISDGEPMDYGAIRAWAPMLREAGDALMEAAKVEPWIVYTPCAAHKGMSYTLNMRTSPSAIPFKSVCPICTPPANS